VGAVIQPWHRFGVWMSDRGYEHGQSLTHQTGQGWPPEMGEGAARERERERERERGREREQRRRLNREEPINMA
jgi:hypothetical protein